MSDEGDPEPAGRQSRRAAINSNSKTTDAGSKKEEFGKHRDMMKKLGPEDLRRIFRQYDEDGSGEISSEELVFVLTKLIGKLPSDDAVQAILEDIDADGSGSIDEDEFLEFFARMENLNQLQAELKKKGKQSGFGKKFKVVYSGMIFFAFCFFCLMDIGANPGTQKASLARYGLIASGSALGFLIFMFMVRPIFMYKCGSKMKDVWEKRQETRDIKARRRAVILEIKSEKELTMEEQLAMQADDAWENLPRPPNMPRAPPPIDEGPKTASSYPSSCESWRISKRTNALSPMSRSGFSDWPTQPSTTPPGTPTVAQNSNFTGYSTKNYSRAREVMASTGNQSFTPTATFKALRNPWLSAEAHEQVFECQPDLWELRPSVEFATAIDKRLMANLKSKNYGTRGTVVRYLTDGTVNVQWSADPASVETVQRSHVQIDSSPHSAFPPPGSPGARPMPRSIQQLKSLHDRLPPAKRSSPTAKPALHDASPANKAEIEVMDLT